MPATITRARRGTPATQTGATNGNGGSQPATDAATLGDLVFNVVTGDVPEPARGGKKESIVIPNTVLNAFDNMLATNPTHDAKSMAHVGPIDLTNEQIQQWLVQGIVKMSKRVPLAKREYVKSTITVTPQSSNKRSVDKADKAKVVNVVWTVRFLSEDEYTAKMNRKAEREAEKNAVTA